MFLFSRLLAVQNEPMEWALPAASTHCHRPLLLFWWRRELWWIHSSSGIMSALSASLTIEQIAHFLHSCEPQDSLSSSKLGTVCVRKTVVLFVILRYSWWFFYLIYSHSTNGKVCKTAVWSQSQSTDGVITWTNFQSGHVFSHWYCRLECHIWCILGLIGSWTLVTSLNGLY